MIGTSKSRKCLAIVAMFFEFQDKGSDYGHPSFFENAATLAASAVAFKNPAWRDEKEVRCQHVVDVTINEDKWVLMDAGGMSEGQEVDGQPIQFQSKNGVIVPFFDMPFDVSVERQPIAEIVFGPRCRTGDGNVRFALGNAGYLAVPFRNAGGAYR